MHYNLWMSISLFVSENVYFLQCVKDKDLLKNVRETDQISHVYFVFVTIENQGSE